ncbi:hypothetical protein [Symbiobacterium terraclitae]|uniref:hypothetical protein n=1 Tax=Symbiobacterium terraclitae TaxID=557451 RepID=UPI0035B53D77
MREERGERGALREFTGDYGIEASSDELLHERVQVDRQNGMEGFNERPMCSSGTFPGEALGHQVADYDSSRNPLAISQRFELIELRRRKPDREYLRTGHGITPFLLGFGVFAVYDTRTRV